MIIRKAIKKLILLTISEKYRRWGKWEVITIYNGNKGQHEFTLKRICKITGDIQLKIVYTKV